MMPILKHVRCRIIIFQEVEIRFFTQGIRNMKIRNNIM